MEETTPTPKVSIFDGAEEVARACASRFVELARASIEAAGLFSVALSGGSTPKRTFELLASDEYREQIDWTKVHVFFGDERCVPPTSSESNYRMADEALLSPAGVPESNVHRISGEGDAAANARLYEDELQTFFAEAAWPRFDLVLLGMGEDGHTASLFPGTEALTEQRAWVAANWVEKLGAYRITLTAPAINHAAHLIFLVTGAGKAAPLQTVLGGGGASASASQRDLLPSQLIRPKSGVFEWMIDRAAAANL